MNNLFFEFFKIFAKQHQKGENVLLIYKSPSNKESHITFIKCALKSPNPHRWQSHTKTNNLSDEQANGNLTLGKVELSSHVFEEW